jgi:hypothetical protein
VLSITCKEVIGLSFEELSFQAGAQEVECLLIKHEALSSNPSNAQKKVKKKKKKRTEL